MTVKAVSVRRRRKGIINVPRYAAISLPIGTNLISIEYDEVQRPDFVAGMNVFKINSSNCLGTLVSDELVDWVNRLNGDNIVVHCEMGLVRSKAVADWIVDEFCYVKVPSLFDLKLGNGIL